MEMRAQHSTNEVSIYFDIQYSWNKDTYIHRVKSTDNGKHGLMPIYKFKMQIKIPFFV